MSAWIDHARSAIRDVGVEVIALSGVVILAFGVAAVVLALT